MIKQFKTDQDAIEAIKILSFDEEIQNDVAMSLLYLQKNEAEAAIFKRVLILITASNMQIISQDGVIKSARELNLPTATYLCHGARILLTLPTGKENKKLLNWLTSGNIENDGTSSKKDRKGALTEGKLIYNRYGSTHGINLLDSGAEETKSLRIGAQSYVTTVTSEYTKWLIENIKYYTYLDVPSAFSYVVDLDNASTTNHFGVDLNLGVDKEGVDNFGKKILGPDGEHGHLYFYIQEPTADQTGAILIGLETYSPDSPKHSKIGSSDSFSPTYGSLWEDLAKKNTDPTILIGSKYNGRIIALTQEEIDTLISVEIERIDNDKLVRNAPSANFIDEAIITPAGEAEINTKIIRPSTADKTVCVSI